jgi:phosphoribosyl 1,2-cyclic phosphate phosphodiesterase
MTLSVTILGCGSSGGVPRPALGWGACNPDNPKNRRRRCSILVERIEGDARTTLLVDTSPDLREQLLDANVQSLDAVLYTHEHADHTHGIDDLRALYMHQRRRLDVYLDDATSRVLYHRFGYCFVTPPGSNYPPIMTEHRIRDGEPITIHGRAGPITALPIRQDHGDIQSLGFRFGGIAYSSDLVDLPAASVPLLAGLDVWIIDSLRYRKHPSHLSVEDALAWIDRLKPKRAVLTNLHSDLDFDELAARLPDQVEPAFDGMRIEVG